MSRLKYLFCVVCIAMAIPAIAVTKTPPPPLAAQVASADQAQQLRAAERERDIALVNERIVQAELKRLESQSSTFQTWLAIYGVILAVLVVAIGVFTYRDSKRIAIEEARKAASEEAARVAKNEVQAAHDDIQTMKDKVVELLRQTEGHANKIRELSEGAEKQLTARPANDEPAAELTEGEQDEIDRTAEEIRQDEARNWSIKDLQILILESRSNRDWSQLLKDAEALYLLHSKDSEARDDASFWRAWALGELEKFGDAADGWERYLSECPESSNKNKSAAYYNWGLALANLAKSKSDADAEVILEEACTKYRTSLEIDQNDYAALNNLGNALDRLARLKDGTEAVNMFEDSIEKLKMATDIFPDNYKPWYNWGCALHHLAMIEEDSKAEATLADACTKYERAAAIHPEMQEAWYNWAIALTSLAKTSSGTKRRELAEKALEIAKRAQQLPPHDAQRWIDEIEAILSEANEGD